MSRYEVFVDSQHDSAFSKCLKKNIKIQQIKMACQIVPETMANDTPPKVRPIKIASKYN